MGSPIFMTNIYFKYFPEDRKSKETDFIAFKKYYQRIYKKTGNEYKKWLQQIDENEKAGRKEENTLYIFGHSLDVTDGDVLREFINHEKQLLQIACKLMRCEGLRKPEQFEAEDWSHQNYDDSFECDLLTRKFIDLVNAYNKENFPIEEGLIAKSSEEGFMRVQQLLQQVLDAKEKVTKENYIELLHFIFDLFDNKHENIEKLWNILLKISRGPAEKVAKNVLNEFIKSSDEELDIIRCNYLLLQIQMNEYFDMKAEEIQKDSEYKQQEE